MFAFFVSKQFKPHLISVKGNGGFNISRVNTGFFDLGDFHLMKIKNPGLKIKPGLSKLKIRVL